MTERMVVKIEAKTLGLAVLIVLSLISDIKTYKIKNYIILPFILFGMIINCIIYGSRGALISLWGMAAPVFILFVFYALRMLGAGDIKLFSAIGAIMGIKFVLYSIAFSFIAGGGIALVILSINRDWKNRMSYLFNYFKCCFLANSLLPYTDFDGKKDGGKFHFTLAIACGVIVSQICRVLS